MTAIEKTQLEWTADTYVREVDSRQWEAIFGAIAKRFPDHSYALGRPGKHGRAALYVSGKGVSAFRCALIRAFLDGWEAREGER